MPGHDTWVNILTKMGVVSPKFQLGMGFGPFAGTLEASSKGMASGIDTECEFVMRYKMTFNDKKPQNLINMSHIYMIIMFNTSR